MLEAYIIDQIRKREERERQDQRPSIQLPVGPPPGWWEREEERRRQEQEPEDTDRGVIVIEL
tara:strand:+ start:2126 stop:2311 length:186 start_codon:yes stop_codon:yes gene_type:complete